MGAFGDGVVGEGGGAIDAANQKPIGVVSGARVDKDGHVGRGLG